MPLSKEEKSHPSKAKRADHRGSASPRNVEATLNGVPFGLDLPRLLWAEDEMLRDSERSKVKTGKTWKDWK